MKKIKKGILLIIVLAMILGTRVCFAKNDNDPMLFLYSVVGTTQTYVDLDAVPGEQSTFSIQLHNSGTTTKTNSLFISDGITANNGGTMVLTSEQAKREKAGSWFNIVEEEVTLKPGEKKVFDFVVDVPKDAHPGTHVAVIYLRSGLNPGKISDPSSAGANFVINEAYSLSSDVILRIDGEVQYGFSIIDKMEQDWIKNKNLTLFFSAVNTGNIYDRPKANLQILNTDDKLVYEADKKIGIVYPGNECTIDFMIPEEKYMADKYKVHFSLAYGKDPVKNVQHEFVWDLSLQEVVDAKTKIVRDENRQSAMQCSVDNNTMFTMSYQKENEHAVMDNTVLIIYMAAIVIVLTVVIRILFLLTKKKKRQRA